VIHSYPWYPADWRGSKSVLLMSSLERGIYRELLDYCWEDGCLPEDEATLIKMARCTPSEWRKAWPAVSREFPVVDGVRRNAKVDERRPGLLAWSEGRRKGAAATNGKRWNSAERVAERVAERLAEESHSVSPSSSTSSTTSTSSGGGAPAPESPPTPPPESNADIEKLRALLVDYGAEVGRDYGRPDDGICKRILAACRGDLAGLYRVMRAKLDASKVPKSLGLFIEFAKEVPHHDSGCA
jgi:uncharacterized protein YdaU (DUF1376 family)